MKRPWLIWSCFALGLIAVLASMALLSRSILRLERESRQRDQLEESVRLALWRMDSILSPIINEEATRPYFEYMPESPLNQRIQTLVPELSAVDSADNPFILARFQLDPAHHWSTLPSGQHDPALLALRRSITSIAALHLPDLVEPVISNGTQQLAQSIPPFNNDAQVDQQIAQQAPSKSSYQQQKAITEYQARAANVGSVGNYIGSNREFNALHASRIREGPMVPRWVGDSLLLVRRVSINSRDYAQGVVLRWPALRDHLLQSTTDLLPHARLVPLLDESAESLTRRLASIPVLLEPGPLALQPEPGLSPMHITLAIAWAAVLLGSSAVAFLMAGTLRLGRRREDFVSAVTHELRTPITTLSMYAEMLQEGMIADEARRQSYLGTLRREADRLGRLIENVLAYSRLERGRHARRIERIALGELLGGMQQRLAQRAEQAHLRLEIDLPDALASAAVLADPSAVEQILFNLVDNASKYAASAPEQCIRISAAPAGRSLAITVRDYGPGLPDAQLKTLFRPFSKSARDAANSAPGVGLGLALSRRLAREMKADLTHTPATPGAAFTLTLPRTSVPFP